MTLIRSILSAEDRAEAALIRRIDEDTGRQLQFGIAGFVALIATSLLTYWLLRRRIFKPLNDLSVLLQQLSSGSASAVSIHNAHPSLLPVLKSYNRLVTRLAELENEHLSRAESLESEVRSATAALLQQQGSLARAERLAAVGETTAHLAHELRKPLAGVLMGLQNLKREVRDPALAERACALFTEVERLTDLLNQSLRRAAHAPEPDKSLHLFDLVRSLLGLVRYQVPRQIRLDNQVPEDLTCRLPENRIRQALLNLILNAVQAIAERSGRITIAAQVADDVLTLSVCDDGPGFPAELLESGIRTFASYRNGGTGLGLAMVRRVAADLGGEMTLSRNKSRGACVSLALPYVHD
jgi:signal transduction histidine kinase